MVWIESHQEIGKHPKTRKAARLAGVSVPTLVGHLHLIWHWALDFAQEGNLSGYEPWQVEDAAMWEGAEGALFDALRLAAYTEVNNDSVCALHDWHDYAGKLIERRRADAARKRGETAKNPPAPRPNSPLPPTELQRNSDGTPTEGAQNPSVTLTVTSTVTNNEESLAPDGASKRPDLTSIDGGKKPKAPSDHERRFNRFWAIYPKKRSKQDAWKAWQRIKPDGDLTERIIEAVKALSKSRDWQKENGQFIPYPATWLNAGGWEDEIATKSAMPKSFDIRDYTPAEWPALAYGPANTPEELELSRQAAERLMG